MRSCREVINEKKNFHNGNNILVDENLSQLLFFRAFKDVFNAVGVNVETELFRFALNFQIQFQRGLKYCEFIHRNVILFSFS